MESRSNTLPGNPRAVIADNILRGNHFRDTVRAKQTPDRSGNGRSGSAALMLAAAVTLFGLLAATGMWISKTDANDAEGVAHASLQSTKVCLRADPTKKLDALAVVGAPTLQPGTFRPPDKLIAILKGAHLPNYAE